MVDRRPPRSHSPIYNPARASAPSITYGKYNDLHGSPIRDAHSPRPLDRSPPVVTHYTVVPSEIPRSEPHHGASHSRRATIDSNPRPIVVTTEPENHDPRNRFAEQVA